MDDEQRAKIRNAALHFIRSPQFLEYLSKLYEVPIANRGILSELQSLYSTFAESAVVEMAFIWMVNSQLTAGKVRSAPGLLIAGASGSEDSERYVESVCSRIAQEEWGDASKATIKQIRKEISDQNYKRFRMRTLPLEFTEGYPVHLFDTMLAADNVLSDDGVPIPFVPCLVNPNSEARIFPIPLFVYTTAHLIEGAPPAHVAQPPPLPPTTSGASSCPAHQKDFLALWMLEGVSLDLPDLPCLGHLWCVVVFARHETNGGRKRGGTRAISRRATFFGAKCNRDRRGGVQDCRTGDYV